MLLRLLTAAVCATAATSADAAPLTRGCRMIMYSEPSNPTYQDESFAITVSRISCSAARSVLTYPLFGYDGTTKHGARGLTGFHHAGFACSARTVYPNGKYYIAFSCRDPRKTISFRWSNVG